MFSQANTGPQMVLDITEEEKNVARSIKKKFKSILKQMSDAIRVISDLRDAIVNQRPEKKDLTSKYSARLLRYRKKIKSAFNDKFLTSTKIALEELSKITDPNMIRLREIIVAEIGELSSGAEAVLDLLREVDRDGFTKRLEEITSQMEKREKAIVDVIDSQLFNHIDHNILGRYKISELKFRIRRRARITKQLVRGK